MPFERYNIDAKSKTIIRDTVYVGSKKTTADATDYISPLSSRYVTRSLIINFNSLKCLIDVKDDDLNSVRNINNYTSEKIAENNFKFTYTFTEADYNRAAICP